MNRRWIFLICFLVGTLSSLSQTPALRREVEGCTDEDYAIFSAALADGLAKQKLDRVMVLDHTVTTGYAVGLAGKAIGGKELQTFYEEVPKDASDDFKARNKNRAELDVRKIQLPFATLSFSKEESEKLNRKDGWETFHQEYPGTAMVAFVSLPGINRGRDRAVLYVGVSCGPICGGGTLILLSKDAGKWKVIDKATTWLS